MCFFFFFFQAEDGIRDLTVTGVQTCALPISLAQGVDVAPNGVRHGLGAHFHRHDPVEICRRHLLQEPLDELLEIIEPHKRYVGSGEWYPTVCTPPTACIDRYHSPRRSASELVPEELHQAVGSHPDLLQRIPVPHRDRAVLRGLAVDRDAERRSGLVLAAVAAADRAAVVVERIA